MLEGCDLPLIVFGPGQAELDNELLVPVAEAAKGERIVLLTTAGISDRELREGLLAEGVNPLVIPGQVFEVDAVPLLGSGKPDFAGAKRIATERLAG